MDRIRIGTRGSRLALAQAREVAEALESACGVWCELVVMSTSGDRRAGPLAAAGGKGLFTAELEEALRDGRLDIAVHSAKDLPIADAPGLCIGAVPSRADARDALVSKDGLSIEDLPRGAKVGTGSLRRRAQVLAHRPDLEIVPIRGNVETRLARALEDGGELDAVVVAMAGLVRSGLVGKLAGRLVPLSVEAVTPAAGQGALAVQCRRDDPRLIPMLRRIDDPSAAARLACERAVLRGLGADCHSCVAVHVRPSARGWQGLTMLGQDDGAIRRTEVVVPSVASAATAMLDALNPSRSNPWGVDLKCR
ncbi:MAG: hydroxymethylbilane synthase [Phycisphaerae bacterium]